MKNFLIYGSYGYTGQLIVELAVKEGMHPILAGHDEQKLREQAKKYNLEYRAFSLDETKNLDSRYGVGGEFAYRSSGRQTSSGVVQGDYDAKNT